MKKTRKTNGDSDSEGLEKIKKLAVAAMFSDDVFMERLVLKGGNAMDLIHRISSRASVDLDFSMNDDFALGERPDLLRKVERLLTETFRAAGYQVFDVKMHDKPPNVTPELAHFWGGYSIEFKLAERATYDRFSATIDQLRRNAVWLGSSSRFYIDISSHEYTTGKEPRELDGLRIAVYSPEMIVAEKLRAICQQMPQYGPVVKRNRAGAARARDFVDIHVLVTACGIDMNEERNLDLLSNMFMAKKVPLSLLGHIGEFREFHRSDFQAVRDTVKPGVTLKDFDYYFDFVLGLVRRLEPFRDI